MGLRDMLHKVTAFREIEAEARLLLSMLYERRPCRVQLINLDPPHGPASEPASDTLPDRLMSKVATKRHRDAVQILGGLPEPGPAHATYGTKTPDIVVLVAKSPQALQAIMKRDVHDFEGLQIVLAVPCASSADFLTAEKAFRAAAASLTGPLREALQAPVPLIQTPGLDVQELCGRILSRAPIECQLDVARAFNVSQQDRHVVADRLVTAAGQLAATIGLTPIPFSDAALLVPLQAAMVTALAYIAGEELATRSVAKWAGSLGVAGALGYGFRFAAQGMAKVIPGAGSFVSAGVAAGGTVAMGRSATRFYLGKPSD